MRNRKETEVGAKAVSRPARQHKSRGTVLEPEPVVLVVDDDVHMQENIAFFVTELLGVKTVRAATNATAFRELATRHVVAVTSDLLRPGGSGFEFLKLMRKRYPHIPVIICSGLSSDTDLKRAFDLGAYGLVPKPHSVEELTNVVRSAMESFSNQGLTATAAKACVARGAKVSRRTI